MSNSAATSLAPSVAALGDLLETIRRGDEQAWECVRELGEVLLKQHIVGSVRGEANWSASFVLTEALLEAAKKCPPERLSDLAFTLGKCGDANAIGLLRKLAGPDQNRDTRLNALLAARSIGGAAGVGILLLGMTDKDERIGDYAAEMLVELLAPSVDDPLREASFIPNVVEQVFPLVNWEWLFQHIPADDLGAAISRLTQRLAEVAWPKDRRAWERSLVEQAARSHWPLDAIKILGSQL